MPLAPPAPVTREEMALEEFGTALARLVKAVRRGRGRVHTRGRLQLTFSQYHLLEAIADGDAVGVSELAARAGVAIPTATRMLDCLGRDGVIVRRGSSGDRRCVEVRITARGRRLVAQKQALVRDATARLYDGLTPAERSSAVLVLTRLADAIDEL